MRPVRDIIETSLFDAYGMSTTMHPAREVAARIERDLDRAGYIILEKDAT